jgi:Flp pilus assembly pilin Flp
VRRTVVAKQSSLTIAENRLGYQQSLASNLSLSWNATVALSGPYLDNVLGRPVKRKCILPASQQVIMSKAAKIMVAGSRKLLIRRQQQNCFPGRNQASAVPEVWYGVRAVRGASMEDTIMSVKRRVLSLWRNEQGQDIAEYAVMLAVILVIVVGTIRLIGSNSNNVFSSVASSIK